ncbi:hypothetical protein PIB30_062086 [Stylosanthes scabra]|uniref:Uncharacterized protein n=1 Tax=Stylosanthes scabra TaxID=79078 RepID=A0ABU6YKE7_9FABA|nr:hypothetical protein [Stylosanthes scabra]
MLATTSWLRSQNRRARLWRDGKQTSNDRWKVVMERSRVAVKQRLTHYQCAMQVAMWEGGTTMQSRTHKAEMETEQARLRQRQNTEGLDRGTSMTAMNDGSRQSKER